MSDRFLASVLPQHETAELYRLMVVGIKEVAVFLMDTRGLITVWNKAAETMKGYGADDVIGQHIEMLYTDEDRAAGRAQQNLEVAADTGFFSEEQWRKRKDGSLFWAHVALTALRDEGDMLLGFSKVTMDLTHHKLLEQCTKEKQEIDLILRAAESGTWKWNVERDEVVISPNLMQLLGHTDVASTLTLDGWLGHVHQQERAALRQSLEAVRSSAKASPFETELRLCGKNGAHQWFFMRASWRQADAAKPSIIGVCVNIDNLKRAEQDRERLFTELAQERSRFANILEQLPSGVILAEKESGKLTYQNQASAAMLGRGLEHIDSWKDYASYRVTDANGKLIPVEDLPLARTVRNHEALEAAITEDLLYERADGARLHFSVTSAAITDSDGVARIAVAVLHDVSGLKQAERTAETERERALVTLAAITDGVITADCTGRISSINPAAERMLGVAADEVRNFTFHDALQFDESGGTTAIVEAVARCLKERRVVAKLPHLTLLRRDGHHFSIESAVAPVILHNGELIGAVLIFHDVTESKQVMRRLGFDASHDPLTGLVNRREFELRLKRALERARHPGGATAALLYMDLDQFKIVNDTCGHSAGDELLKLLANTYVSQVRERDTLARIGGDEFALIVEHCDVEEALAVAQKILEATRNFRYACKDRLFQLGVSIGLTPIDASTASGEEAMRRADHACYIAKERGRNRVYVHYHGDLDFAQRRGDMHWVTRLTHAFQNEQMQLYYQPIVSLDPSNTMMHYEVLLRLRNGRSGPVLPSTFMPAAERYNVILKIDRWVLRRTLEWLAQHKQHTDKLDMCSINLSGRSLADQTFHTYAAELMDASGVPANKLCFEISEHGAIADMQKTTAFIEALSRRGCRFSLDDFGTGMTSFSYLKQLQVDFIKIDGSFIQMMSSSKIDDEMVRFTNDISHMMGRKTIAEYVSDTSILASLRDIGVDFAQGFCMGKPRPLF